MPDEIKAGAIYFAIIFVVGFVLGTIRTLLLIPVVGITVGVLIELPVILTVSWFVCRWVVTRFKVPGDPETRLTMGAVAFVLLMAAEYLTAFLLFGVPMPMYFASFLSLPGLIGLAGQVAFALFPWLQRGRAA